MYECSNNNNGFGEERCPHRPRATKADVLDAAVWRQVVAALTDTDYLTDLATSHLSALTDGDESKSTGGLRRQLAKLQGTETNIVRRLAEDDDLLHGDALERALEATTTDRVTIEKELSRIEEARRGTLTVELVPEAVQRLSHLAKTRLANPTIELMAEVFDLFEVDLIRIEGRTFEGVARIPFPDPENGGEVWKGALQRRLLEIEETRHDWERRGRINEEEEERCRLEISRTAAFTVTFAFRDSAKTWARIIARNNGPALARSVRLDVWGVSVDGRAEVD